MDDHAGGVAAASRPATDLTPRRKGAVHGESGFHARVEAGERVAPSGADRLRALFAVVELPTSGRRARRRGLCRPLGRSAGRDSAGSDVTARRGTKPNEKTQTLTQK